MVRRRVTEEVYEDFKERERVATEEVYEDLQASNDEFLRGDHRDGLVTYRNYHVCERDQDRDCVTDVPGVE